MSDDEFQDILGTIESGERANPALMERLYAELHAIANRLMRTERGSHTLQPTALVHEAFLRLVDAQKVGAQGRLYFLDAAAVTMRRVLVDHARASSAAKRGGGLRQQRVTLSGLANEDAEEEGGLGEVDLAALDEALSELATLDERQAKIVELRFFGGMSGQEIADHFEMSRSTVVRDLAFARAWLQRRLRAGET